MDRVERYRDILHQFLTDYRNWYAEPVDSGVDTEIVSDDDNGQYLLMRVGWHGETRIRRPVFYMRLKNGKIWIEEDWTKDGLAEGLIAAGVSANDIVLAFNPPFLRPDAADFPEATVVVQAMG